MTTELTTAQAAKILGLKPRRVRVFCATGRLKARRHGSEWAITAESVEAFRLVPRRTGNPAWLKTCEQA
jgi:excisionase family DNA binding protein